MTPAYLYANIAEEYPDELSRIVFVGARLRIFYGRASTGNATLHVRAIVDGDMVVARSWKRGAWVYSIDSLYTYLLRWQNGVLTLLGVDDDA